ncbi:MAG: hypothetical protein JWP10_724 [Nocardioidaceae bacterium]|nr:hypothetical protein [Nocardioidaceae bacterium]
MTENHAPHVLKASSLTDLIDVVPALFGFHPRESFIAISTHGPRRRFGLHARIDLPQPVDAELVADMVMGQVRHQKPDGVILMCFSDDQRAADAMMAAARDRLGHISLDEAARVGSDRFWSYLCSDVCCPPEGVPIDTGSGVLLAEAIYAGLSVLPDRAALVDTIAAVTGTEFDTMVRATEVALGLAASALTGPTSVDSLAEGLSRIEPALSRVLAGGADFSDDEVATISVWMTAIAVRDEMWTRMTRANARAHVDLWTRVARRVVPPFEPAVLSLLAFACWLNGNGVLCRAALERAFEGDPDYSMALLIEQTLDSAISPDLWSGFMHEQGETA